MRKSSRAISLALVGSSLILAGCGRNPSDADGNSPPATGRDRSTSGYHGGWYGGGVRRYGGVGIGGSTSGGKQGGSTGTGIGGSSHGGFGGAGHAAGGS